MKLHIRKEYLEDKNAIYELITEAFKSAEHSDGDEQNLVNRLRNSNSYIPDLSLVALDNEIIIGHIMFTKLSIVNDDNTYDSLALAPLSVLPEYQGKSVGSKLIEQGLKIAKELGYKSVIVLGSEKYYPRFRFEEASKFQVKAPFEVPSENFMAIELKEDALKNINGTVVYAKEFFEA